MSRRDEILVRLGAVLDPELDRSVVEMGFIEDIAEADAAIRITFRLPTQWCAANFAFLMASDMREAVAALPWVRSVDIRLVDHFAAGRINAAVNQGLGFADVFPGEAGGDLGALRRAFAEKAFLSRQEALLDAMLSVSDAPPALDLTMAGLADLACREHALGGPALRYLALRRQVGGGTAGDAPAFTDLAGDAVTPGRLAEHRRASRRVRGAADANAEHCQLLMLARRVAPAPADDASPRGLYE